LKEVKGLEKLTKLKELYLGKNKIVKIQGLDMLRELEILSFQANRITVIEGLDELTSLQFLYLSENGLEEMAGLSRHLKLNTLDLATNRIARIPELGHLTDLEEFWFNDNKVADWKEVEKLRALPKLTAVYMEHNPICKETGYRRKMQLTLPKLTHLDSVMCRPTPLASAVVNGDAASGGTDGGGDK